MMAKPPQPKSSGRTALVPAATSGRRASAATPSADDRFALRGHLLVVVSLRRERRTPDSGRRRRQIRWVLRLVDVGIVVYADQHTPPLRDSFLLSGARLCDRLIYRSLRFGVAAFVLRPAPSACELRLQSTRSGLRHTRTRSRIDDIIKPRLPRGEYGLHCPRGAPETRTAEP